MHFLCMILAFAAVSSVFARQPAAAKTLADSSKEIVLNFYSHLQKHLKNL